MAMKVFVKEAGEIIFPAMAGAVVGDAVAGAVTGKFGLTGWKRFGGSLGTKLAIGFIPMIAGEFSNSPDVHNVVTGWGAGILATIPNDVSKGAYGMDIQDAVYAKAIGAGVKASAMRQARAASYGAGQMAPGQAPGYTPHQALQLQREIVFRGAR